jgi:hypothetical protein
MRIFKVKFNKLQERMGDVQFRNPIRSHGLDNEMDCFGIPGLGMGGSLNILSFL